LFEIGAFCNGLRPQSTEKLLMVLRFTNIIVPWIDSPMGIIIRESFSPLLIGVNPILKLINDDDIIRSLVHVIEEDIPGSFRFPPKNSASF
jgi:hypothetical protein